ncbi:hypothetical protein AB1Y20_015495 [Prymnesium parvum]|uniref:PH domain-containing protein n=1 Tax=Prymnesium parvum TaxID=97485 RepID=A0AB34K1P2_PRYPA
MLVTFKPTVQPRYRGKLVKAPRRGSLLSKSRTRYFVITEVAIEWFKDENHAKWAVGHPGAAKGRVDLKGATVERIAAYGSGKVPALAILSGRDQLTLWAEKHDSPSVLDEWGAGLVRVIKALEGTPTRPSETNRNFDTDDSRKSDATSAAGCHTLGRSQTSDPNAIAAARHGSQQTCTPTRAQSATAVEATSNNVAVAMPSTALGMAEAEPRLREALRVARENLGDKDPETLTALCNYGRLLQEQGRLSEAEALFIEDVEARREVYGPRHPGTLLSLGHYATVLQLQGKLDEARPICETVLEGRREALGQHHPGTLLAMSNYGRLLQEQGDLAAAEPYLREVLMIRRARLGPRHQATMASIANLGGLLREQGKLEEATVLFREDLDSTLDILGPRHPDTLIAIGNMVDLLRERGELEEACRTLGDAPTIAADELGANHLDTLLLEAKAARLAHARGDMNGESTLQQVLQKIEAKMGKDHPQSRKYRRVLETMGRSSANQA